jgi:demethylmenaquinone methyltransferase/2-methoxy-6-polyprenyl-1,4-benzoquinol methylase
MSATKSELVDLYRRRASNYDLTANLYYLIGYREWAYRKLAVAALELEPGATVVEIGCGTGLNFGLYQSRIGRDGRVIGIDLNDAMLAKAAERVDREGWKNVELVQADGASYRFPEGLDAAISTFAIALVPEFDEVIRNAAGALRPGGHLAVLDFKRPDSAPLWLVRALVAITAPFGVSLDLAERHPWESVERYLPGSCTSELYFGFSYLSVGQAPSDDATISASVPDPAPAAEHSRPGTGSEQMSDLISRVTALPRD